MTTTFVVACEAKGNWTVADNNGAVDGPFKNWVKAVDFARSQAVAEGALIVRLSAKDNRVVEMLKPRVAHARKSLSVATEILEPASTVQFVDELVETETLTEESLNALPTPALVAVYNANGGNITGKFKGARKSLVTKILANVA